MTNYDIVPAHLAIRAMRANGFKGTDHAVAELIDNSIQAGQQNGNTTTNVEVICIESPEIIGDRTYQRISEIAILDDAGGMSSDLLRSALMFGQGSNLVAENQKGMGKFGMGLPNASISQCLLVEVYSWKNGSCFFTKLDVNAVLAGGVKEVPEPTEVEIPEKYKKMSQLTGTNGGTLVVWKNLDQTNWSKSQTFFKNSEFVVGRMYRHFIEKNTAIIKFRAFSSDAIGNIEKINEVQVRPNDPLMLMTGTSAPDEYATSQAFEEHGRPNTLDIPLGDGTVSIVTIKYSVAKISTRKVLNGIVAGNLPIGKYVARNLGVSIVRAGRELDLNTSWVKPGDPLERWWGVEISFEPELDKIFGVTNTKQAATNLYRANISEDAKNLDMKDADLEIQMQESNDIKRFTYKISQTIETRLASLRSQLTKQNSSEENKARRARIAEERASRASDLRLQQGFESGGDRDRKAAGTEKRTQVIEKFLGENGAQAADAKELASAMVRDDIRYHYVEARLSSGAIFEFTQEAGEYLVKLNNRHPVFNQLIELLKNNNTEDTPAYVGLKMLINAWVRMEDEAADGSVLLEALEDTRIKWGTMARDFMRGMNE